MASSSLERLNLNLPSEARRRLERLATTAEKSVSAYARQLLLKSIAREEERAFRRALAASRTPERRERDKQIAEAMERLRG
jgi:plasmid stability protein